ncbi:NAD(P)H-dependent oxidoreductase [uncultured Corynebacterium sp.]|uniref:NAD(P)H-dependent oxidoreductase n=1 Tax=uncultured Corynebacterium sp. TaxID=159447 RepID=UPI0025FE348A|nr:NAD(P)H-dependent oxidoreductase [uncultured Corynebacterium sp.]
MTTVLIVHHSPSPVTAALSSFVLDAARSAAAEANEGLGLKGEHAVRIVERHPLDPELSAEQLAEEMIGADAVIFGTTANFGYISGALKHYFDSTYMAAREQTAGKPVSWWIRGGYDTTGAAKAMRSLTTGFEMRVAAEPVEFTGEWEPHQDELATMAQSLVGEALG